MPALINTSLFIHREVRTNGFNNLVCIAHPVAAPGTYYGDVFLQKNFLGRFRLNCDANSANRQVNIDLSHFDPLFRHRHTHMKVSIPSYSLVPGTPLVLHATEHHNGLYIVLEKAITEGKALVVFDSRKLMKGDVVMLRPIATGDFQLRNDGGQQQVGVHVNTAAEGKYYHPSKLEPIRLTLSPEGFNERSICIQPFQLIVVAIEVNDAGLELVEVKA